MTNKNSLKIITPVQEELFEVEYSIRKSNRAKYLQINVLPGKGVEVVAPGRTTLKQARHFLQQHHAWIIRQLKKYGPLLTADLPHEISLQAMQKSWQIEYRSGSYKHYRIKDEHPILHLTGPRYDQVIYQQKLQHWLRQSAKNILPQWLESISKHTGLSYRKLVIRSQKTRWGSCSATGTISLNDRLMFLPHETVRYVMLHELCHTKYMNHSSNFWNTVEKYCPDFSNHEKNLLHAHYELPGWSY